MQLVIAKPQRTLDPYLDEGEVKLFQVKDFKEATLKHLVRKHYPESCGFTSWTDEEKDVLAATFSTLEKDDEERLSMLDWMIAPIPVIDAREVEGENGAED